MWSPNTSVPAARQAAGLLVTGTAIMASDSVIATAVTVNRVLKGKELWFNSVRLDEAGADINLRQTAAAVVVRQSLSGHNFIS